MDDVILVVNAGSSNIKLALFDSKTLQLVTSELITLTSYQSQSQMLTSLLSRIEKYASRYRFKGVGHRVVHGGIDYVKPVCVNNEVLERLKSLSPLAPLHQPFSLEVVNGIGAQYPQIPQIACFDTAYHHTQLSLAKLFPIPRYLTDQGIIRFGFHGLSYEYIASVLPRYLPNIADGKLIVAHLGHGASLCAMESRRSVATSMGFTALDGLMMGTRCGSVDPGLLLYLLNERKMSVEHLTQVLYYESGLLGVSELSGDMRVLQSSNDPKAIEAVNLFCFRVIHELCGLCGILGGCDGIVFTAGIGEHAAMIRRKICAGLAWCGVILDEALNDTHQPIISHKKSAITVAVIPTDEAWVIAQQTQKLIM